MKHRINKTLCDAVALLCLIGGLVWGCEALVQGQPVAEAGLSVLIGACMSALFAIE